MRFPDTTLLRCRIIGGENTIIDRWWCRRETDPFWRIYRNRDAGAAIIHERGRLDMEAGGFYVVPAWTMFQGRCRGPVRHDYLHVQIGGLPGGWLRRSAQGPLRLAGDSWWAPLFDRLGAERHPAELLRLHALLHLAVSQALATAPPPDVEDRSAIVIAPALAAIATRLASPPSIAALAGLCQVSPDHLARCFADACGSTPARWIQQQRIAAAAEELADGATIEHAATRLGFADRAHFTRVFRRVTGSTPGAYRARLHHGSQPAGRRH